LLADYADDAVMLSAPAGVLTGKDAIAAMYGPVFDGLFPPADTTLEVTAKLIAADHALVHWTATTPKVRTVGGFDAFVVRGGKIIVQAGGCEIVTIG
jgi:ketosteroid isomerase-like protein